MKNDVTKLILSITGLVGTFLLLIAFWVIRSRYESETYNRLTGAQTTTFDAMFVELRVQDSPTERRD